MLPCLRRANSRSVPTTRGPPPALPDRKGRRLAVALTVLLPFLAGGQPERPFADKPDPSQEKQRVEPRVSP
jgi:hypothetical protein